MKLAQPTKNTFLSSRGRCSRWTITEEEHIATIQGMSEAGVRFTAGLDMGMPQADHAKSGANAWAYHEWLGWDTWRAIRANTADTAEALLVGDQVGRIEPGKIADLAAFRGDPASNIRELSQRRHRRTGRQRGQAQRRVAGLDPRSRTTASSRWHGSKSSNLPAVASTRTRTMSRPPSVISRTITAMGVGSVLGQGWSLSNMRSTVTQVV